MAEIEKNTENGEYLYSAFISYRHAHPDQAIAARILRSIENFVIPKEYQKSDGKDHFRKVFRDSDEMSLDRDLSEGIDYALAHSEYLIAILSPQYKESAWCIHEIEEFLKTHDRKNVLCVLAEGEPQDVLPETITHFRSEEDPDEIIIKEPLCADYRQDRSTAERYELPRLLCPMLGCSYDDLVKRQEAYRRKRIFRMGAIALAVAVVIIILQLVNLLAIFKSYKETLYSRSQTLAAQSLQKLTDFDREEALRLALKALPDEEDLGSNPVTAEALYALTKATYVYQPNAFAQIRSRSMQNKIINYKISEDQSRIVTLDSAAWLLVQNDSGKRLSYWQIDGSDTEHFGFILQNRDTVLTWRGGNFYSYDYENYKRNWCTGICDSSDEDFILSAELIDDTLCSVLTKKGAAVVDLADGKVTKQLPVESIPDSFLKENSAAYSEGTSCTFSLYKQRKDDGGTILLSGCLTLTGPDSAQKKLLCIARWDPGTNGLITQSYDLPPHCLALEPAGPDRLIAVTAENDFDVSDVNRLSRLSSLVEFSYTRILCLDRESLALQWDYNTDVMQPIDLPRIHYYPPEIDDPRPLISLLFDVDNYIFDIYSGSLYFASTCPDSILLVKTTSRDAINYFCANHNQYSVRPGHSSVVELEGLSPFPETVQAADMMGDNIIAFSGSEIEWFSNLYDSDLAKEFRFPASDFEKEYFDAGSNLLAVHDNATMMLTDLTTNRIVDEIPLNKESGTGGAVEWRFAGALPDSSGFLMLSRNVPTGQVRLYVYDIAAGAFKANYTMFEKAEFGLDNDWINTFGCHDGIVYTMSPDEDNTLLFINTVTAESGRIPVMHVPSSLRLADAYDDFVNEYALSQPSIWLSPDGSRLFSTACDPVSRKEYYAIIDLRTGECTIPDTTGSHIGRSQVAAFNSSNSSVACSTDYSVLIYSGDYSQPVSIPISGLNVRSMTWFKEDLWIEFSNNTIRRYTKGGELLSEIRLDYTYTNVMSTNPMWVTIPLSDKSEGLMLIDKGNMNLLSADSKATTPILHIPDFVGWNNESDTFIVMALMKVDVFHVYPHYTAKDLQQIGTDQLNKMEKERE